jgi:hypothetical protein
VSTGSTIRLLPLVALTALIGACAKPPPPPTLSLAGRNCMEKPDLGSATAVPLADGKPVSVTLDDKTACIEAAGLGRAAYVAFSLPQSDQDYMLSVTSTPVGEGRFSPWLALLDADGKKLRDIPPDMFMAHGASLHAGLRPHPGERYLIVSSDPETIGQTKSQIADGTRVQYAYAPGILIPIHTGYENSVAITNAYNGIVTVTAQPIPKNK